VGIRKRLRLNYLHGKTRFCRPSESCFWIVVRFTTKRKPAQLSWFSIKNYFVYKLYFKEKTTYLGWTKYCDDLYPVWLKVSSFIVLVFNKFVAANVYSILASLR
jgi:hypothetical protein